MNWRQIGDNWEQFRAKVKEKWDRVTDDDLTAIQDDRKELLDLIQVRYGYDKVRAARELDEMVRSVKPARMNVPPQPLGAPDNLAGPTVKQ